MKKKKIVGTAGEESVIYAQSMKTWSSNPTTITLKRRRKNVYNSNKLLFFVLQRYEYSNHYSAEQSNCAK